MWEHHFDEYGRGQTMYRTSAAGLLVLKGIPATLRAELWMVFSGGPRRVLAGYPAGLLARGFLVAKE